jgi:hypothetical protein
MVEDDDMVLNRKRGPINRNFGNPSLIKDNFKSRALVLVDKNNKVETIVN